MTREEMRNLKAGDVVVCMSDSLEAYKKGERYTIGTDKYGDFGVLIQDDDHNAVYSEACIKECGGNKDYENFYPGDWMLADVVMEVVGYQLKPGDQVIRISGDDEVYNIGEVYTIGYDDTWDYGVLSKVGNVLRYGIIASRTRDSDFNPSEWAPYRTQAQKDTPFKEGDVVRYIGESGGFYKKGNIYNVGYDCWNDFGVQDADGDVMARGRFDSSQFNLNEWELVRTAQEAKELQELYEKYPVGSKWVYIGENADGYPKGFVTEVVAEGTVGTGDYGMRALGTPLVYYDGCIHSPNNYYPKNSFKPENWIPLFE